MPCLLVRGARSDLVGAAGVREFRALVPHAGYVDVKEAAHMVAGDDNGRFNGALLDFIAQEVEPRSKL